MASMCLYAYNLQELRLEMLATYIIPTDEGGAAQYHFLGGESPLCT